MLRATAISVDVIAVGAIVWLMVTKGLPAASEAWPVIILTVAPILSIAALTTLKSGFSKSFKNSLIAMRVERLKLEEQARITALRNDTLVDK